MKRVVIIHCWGGNPNYCWYSETKKELEDKRIRVEVPEMPNTDNPKFSEWVPVLKNIIGKTDKELILVGHSLGCITIMRYLESLEENEEIGGVVFVAGFTDDLGFEEIKTFFKDPIDFEKIKKHCSKFTAIHSDNDPYVDMKYADILKDKLNVKVIVKHGMDHFSGSVDGEKSCLSLPDVSKSVLEMYS